MDGAALAGGGALQAAAQRAARRDGADGGESLGEQHQAAKLRLGDSFCPPRLLRQPGQSYWSARATQLAA
jgi:hypothetical protein